MLLAVSYRYSLCSCIMLLILTLIVCLLVYFEIIIFYHMVNPLFSAPISNKPPAPF